MKGGNSKDSWRDQTEVVPNSLKDILEIKLERRKEVLIFRYKIKVMKYQSTLAAIASLVWEAETAEQARTTLIEHLAGTKVKDRDKMIEDVQRLETLEAIHRYTANALLKFEGLSTKL